MDRLARMEVDLVMDSDLDSDKRDWKLLLEWISSPLCLGPGLWATKSRTRTQVGCSVIGCQKGQWDLLSWDILRRGTQETECNATDGEGQKGDAAPARGAGGWAFPTLRFCLSFRWFHKLSCDSVVFGGLDVCGGMVSRAYRLCRCPTRWCPTEGAMTMTMILLGRLMMSELYTTYHVLGFWLSVVLLLGCKTDYGHIFYHQRLKIVFSKQTITIFSSLILMQPLWSEGCDSFI